MKILKGIGLYFVYPLVMFLLGFFCHMAYSNYFYPHKNQRISSSNYASEDLVEVTETQDKITTCDTMYVVIEYNLLDKTQNKTTKSLPEKYLGMTREKLEEALMEYESNPTLADQEKGFISLQLERFSDKQVVVQKNYRPMEKPKGYYLEVWDGKIVVLEEDRETVYLTTDIYVDALSDSLKQELILGKFIYSMEELYGFLESYTS